MAVGRRRHFSCKDSSQQQAAGCISWNQCRTAVSTASLISCSFQRQATGGIVVLVTFEAATEQDGSNIPVEIGVCLSCHRPDQDREDDQCDADHKRHAATPEFTAVCPVF